MRRGTLALTAVSLGVLAVACTTPKDLAGNELFTYNAAKTATVRIERGADHLLVRGPRALEVRVGGWT